MNPEEFAAASRAGGVIDVAFEVLHSRAGSGKPSTARMVVADYRNLVIADWVVASLPDAVPILAAACRRASTISIEGGFFQHSHGGAEQLLTELRQAMPHIRPSSRIRLYRRERW